MKLSLDFSELTRLGRIMMPNGPNFSLARHDMEFQPIDIALKEGIDIDIGDLDDSPGPFSVKGRQVLLYIKDHTTRFDVAVQDGERGNRFHLVHCVTLEKMKQNNRLQRYVATNRLDGLFPIEGAAISPGMPSRKDNAKLRVCKYCLLKLNYKDSARDSSIRHKNFVEFSLTEFFSHYSTCFKHMPTELDNLASVGYTSDWAEISKRTREAVGYKCDHCLTDFSKHTRLCDVHHINGVKSDNRPSNLRVLCRDCHRKQPMHGGIFISLKDSQLIHELRSQQGLAHVKTWKDAYKISDTAIHGDIRIMERNGFPPPSVGYAIPHQSGDHATVAAAWPDRRIAVSLRPYRIPGWKVHLVGEICGSSS